MNMQVKTINNNSDKSESIKMINTLIKADYDHEIQWLLDEVLNLVETEEKSIPEAYNIIRERVTAYNDSRCKHCGELHDVNYLGLCSICDHNIKLQASKEILFDEDFVNGNFNMVWREELRERNILFV